MRGRVANHAGFDRLRRISFTRIQRHLGNQIERFRKYRRRRRSAGSYVEKTAVFIVGSNKSGTQMVVRAIGKSPLGWDYPESDFSIAFSDYYLRPAPRIAGLIRRSPAPLVSFSAILDSQWTDDLLDRHPGSKALWVYRRYQDAANSSVKHWGGHPKDLARYVAEGTPEKMGARGERVPERTAAAIRELYREEVSEVDGACLYWYMRNHLFFELGLDRDPRVLLVQYEDLATHPDAGFRRIFEFLGYPYHEEVAEGVFSDAIGEMPAPSLDPAIQRACEALANRLDARYADVLAGAAATI